MTKTFTRNDMIRYFYSEMLPHESEDFARMLKTSFQLREEFESLKTTLIHLDKSMVEPPQRVTDQILDFSEHFDRTGEPAV